LPNADACRLALTSSPDVALRATLDVVKWRTNSQTLVFLAKYHLKHCILYYN